jgi:hypothetical protein
VDSMQRHSGDHTSHFKYDALAMFFLIGQTEDPNCQYFNPPFQKSPSPGGLLRFPRCPASTQDRFVLSLRLDVSISIMPAAWFHVQANGYSGSGFDRGHNCPSADRTSSATANSSTFLMTNMIPQAPRNNQGTWANFENYLRSLVRSGDELYIVMGSYGSGGTGSKGYQKAIDGGHVTVPAHIWKVAVVLSNGKNDLRRITTSTRVIAINTPDINSINSKWQTYATSVDAIEKATGDDLLSNVPVAIQKVIEAKVDSNSRTSPAPGSAVVDALADTLLQVRSPRDD